MFDLKSKEPIAIIWFSAYLLLLLIDCFVLCSAIFEKNWKLLEILDSHGGMILIGSLMMLQVFSIYKCILISKKLRHLNEVIQLYIAVILMSIATIWFFGQGLFGCINSIEREPYLTSNFGKWIFTIGCSFLFLPWLWSLEDELSIVVAMRHQEFDSKYGSLYGFMYSASGHIYIIVKLIMLMLLFFVKWLIIKMT